MRPITGTFIDEITYDIPSSNWSETEWKNELDIMKSVGIDTLIFIRGGFGSKTIYPSDYFKTKYADDFAGFILNEAGKRNMKVFVGLCISGAGWREKGGAKGEIHLNRHFINEFYARYKDYPAFTGWYIPHETSRNNLNITEVMNGLSYLCKETNPDMPVLISPFFHTPVTCSDNFFTVEQHTDEWNDIFLYCGKQIDICAFQDGSAPISEMRDFFAATKKLCDSYNIEHWVNTETFERDVRKMYYPIPFSTLKQKLEMHKEYASKIITFEFSHFLSPQSIYPSARNLNNLYKEYYLK